MERQATGIVEDAGVLLPSPFTDLRELLGSTHLQFERL